MSHERRGWRHVYRDRHGVFPEKHAVISFFPDIEWTVSGERGEMFLMGDGARATNAPGKCVDHAWALGNANLSRVCLLPFASNLLACRMRQRRYVETRDEMVERFGIAVDLEKWEFHHPAVYVVATKPTAKGGPMTAVHAELFSHLHAAAGYLKTQLTYPDEVWPGSPRLSTLDYYLHSA